LVDRKYFNPAEVDFLIGNPTKANTKLGWFPEYDLTALINEMVKSIRKKQFLKD